MTLRLLATLWRTMDGQEIKGSTKGSHTFCEVVKIDAKGTWDSTYMLYDT